MNGWADPPDKWDPAWARAVLQTLDQQLGRLNANKVGYAKNISQRFCHDGVTAAGTTQAAATVLQGDINRISGVATGSEGVKLPSARAGMRVTVINAGTMTSQVYPYLGERVGTASANVAVGLAPQAKRMFEAPADQVWY